MINYLDIWNMIDPQIYFEFANKLPIYTFLSYLFRLSMKNNILLENTTTINLSMQFIKGIY